MVGEQASVTGAQGKKGQGRLSGEFSLEAPECLTDRGRRNGWILRRTMPAGKYRA